MFDGTGTQMPIKQEFIHFSQGLLDRLGLVENIDTISAFFGHRLDLFDVAKNGFEAAVDFLLMEMSHGIVPSLYTPPPGGWGGLWSSVHHRNGHVNTLCRQKRLGCQRCVERFLETANITRVLEFNIVQIK